MRLTLGQAAVKAIKIYKQYGHNEEMLKELAARTEHSVDAIKAKSLEILKAIEDNIEEGN